MLLNNKTLNWISCGGMLREQIVDDIRADSIACVDMKDHLWVAHINENGTTLSCIQLKLFPHSETKVNQWHVLRQPEYVESSFHDVPKELLEMTRTTNHKWRSVVEKEQQRSLSGKGDK